MIVSWVISPTYGTYPSPTFTTGWNVNQLILSAMDIPVYCIQLYIPGTCFPSILGRFTKRRTGSPSSQGPGMMPWNFPSWRNVCHFFQFQVDDTFGPLPTPCVFFFFSLLCSEFGMRVCVIPNFSNSNTFKYIVSFWVGGVTKPPLLKRPCLGVQMSKP